MERRQTCSAVSRHVAVLMLHFSSTRDFRIRDREGQLQSPCTNSFWTQRPRIARPVMEDWAKLPDDAAQDEIKWILMAQKTYKDGRRRARTFMICNLK